MAPALLGLLAGASLLCAAPPSWLTAFPRYPDSYVGIGRGDKRLHPDRFREMAQEEALAQISREISVQVRSESRSSRSEDDGGWSESYRQEVTAATRNDLAGYERADVYETEEAFWVLYTLDKERFRGLREAKAAALLDWMSREVEALDAALAGRRYQEAVERHAAVRARCAAEGYGDAWTRAHFPEPETRLAVMTAQVYAATRNLVLETGAEAWVLDWRTVLPAPGRRFGTAEAPAGRAGTAGQVAAGERWRRRVAIALTDAGTREKATGPVALWISDGRGTDAAACRVVTDGQGRLDLAEPALRCGLGPGSWTAAWMGPDGRAHGLRREVAFLQVDLLVTLEAGKDAVPEAAEAAREAGRWAEPALPLLRDELVRLENPGYRLVAIPSDPAPPTLEIRLLDASTDLLEGMHFSTLRGRVRFPDGLGTVEIVGKSGHADPGRSRKKAARDFARQVEARLRPPSAGG